MFKLYNTLFLIQIRSQLDISSYIYLTSYIFNRFGLDSYDLYRLPESIVNLHHTGITCPSLY